jgi:hypothetical protein
VKVRNVAKIVAESIDMDQLQKVSERTINIKDQKGELKDILDMTEYQN